MTANIRAKTAADMDSTASTAQPRASDDFDQDLVVLPSCWTPATSLKRAAVHQQIHAGTEMTYMTSRHARIGISSNRTRYLHFHGPSRATLAPRSHAFFP